MGRYIFFPSDPQLTAMSDKTSGPYTLKVDFDGDIRRYKGWPVGEGDACEWSVLAAVRMMYDLSEKQAKTLVLRYKDNDGDMCTLTELTLPDALGFARSSGNVLRVAASRGPLPSSTAAENSSVEATDISFEQGL